MRAAAQRAAAIVIALPWTHTMSAASASAIGTARPPVRAASASVVQRTSRGENHVRCASSESAAKSSWRSSSTISDKLRGVPTARKRDATAPERRRSARATRAELERDRRRAVVAIATYARLDGEHPVH